MENMTFQAHFDGAQILLDDPIKLVANTKLLVTVLEPSVEPEHSLASRQQENQRLLATLNEVYQDVPTDEEREQLRQMTASQRRLVEGEW